MAEWNISLAMYHQRNDITMWPTYHMYHEMYELWKMITQMANDTERFPCHDVIMRRAHYVWDHGNSHHGEGQFYDDLSSSIVVNRSTITYLWFPIYLALQMADSWGTMQEWTTDRDPVVWKKDRLFKIPNRWFSAGLQYPPCVSNGDTAVVVQTWFPNESD